MTAAKRRTRFMSTALLIVFVLMASGGFALDTGAEPPPPGSGSYETSELPSEALAAPMVEVEAVRELGSQKLDSALARVAAAAEEAEVDEKRLASELGLRISGERIQIHVVFREDRFDTVVAEIEALGGDVTGRHTDGDLVQAWLPPSALTRLAEVEGVNWIKPPAQAVPLGPLPVGDSTTEALDDIDATTWHPAGVNGAGVKVGVIDLGFLGYPGLLGVDLPASVTVKNFVDGESDSQVDGTSVHGTACAEIIHDLAPDAQLFLAKVGTNLDLHEAVTWLKDTHQVDVISTSLGWYNLTPGDGTGEFADLVGQARSVGILWATAAGNDRQAHWGGPFSDPDTDTYHNFNGVQEINFFGPGGDFAYYLPAGVLIRGYLRWDDWTSVDQDFDLHLVRWNNSTSGWDYIDSSLNWQNGGPGQTPAEFVSALTSGSDTFYGFIFEEYSATRAVNFEFFAPKVTELEERLHARSLANLADAPGAITVAALDVTSPYPQEPYSSEGPTNGPGGTESGGFTKPDLSGYANVSTESYGPVGFNGTSAATPHVAVAAALVRSAFPGFSPDDIEAFLTGRAVDMGAPGMDTIFGYGRVFLGTPPEFSYLPLIMK